MRAAYSPLEVEEWLDLRADPSYPVGNGLAGVQRPLGALAAGVADQPGRSADQGERPVPG